MSTQVQIRRGTTAGHTSFTGAVAELTFDTDLKTVRAHDGSTTGGIVLARSSDVTSKANIADLTTANVTEVTNLYYTVARANTAIDNRVTKAFIDALNVDADTLDGNDSTYFAPISSPSLTGTPLAPTASAGTNTTQVATTAFVRTEVTNLIASAPATYAPLTVNENLPEVPDANDEDANNDVAPSLVTGLVG